MLVSHGPRFCSDHCLLLDLFSEIMSLKGVVPVTLFSQKFTHHAWSNAAETTREFCRTICETCGQYCLVPPFLELGTALTLGKSMAHGALFDELNVSAEDCMLQGVHIKGLIAFVQERRTVEKWKECLIEVNISYHFISDCLWSDEWDPVPDECLETLGNAATVLEDLKLLLEMSIAGAQKRADSEAGCVAHVSNIQTFFKSSTHLSGFLSMKTGRFNALSQLLKFHSG